MTKQINFECKMIDPCEYRKLLLDLFEEAFEEKMAVDQFIWKYENNPLGKMKVWSIWDKDTGVLAGTYGAFKRYFIHKGSIVTVYQRADSMVKPEYRRKGIFTQLLKEMNKFLSENGVLFNFGYSNDKSASGIRKFNNSRELYYSTVYVFVNGAENIVNSYLKIKGILSRILISVGTAIIRMYNMFCGYYKENDISLEPLKEFNDLPEKWSYEAAREHQFFPLRNKEFLQWKVIDVPKSFKKNLFAFWMIKKGKKIAYCVLYRDSTRNVLKLIDILCENIAQNMKDSISAVRYFAISNKYDAVTTNVASEIYSNAFETSGFIKNKAVRCTLHLQCLLEKKLLKAPPGWLYLSFLSRCFLGS